MINTLSYQQQRLAYFRPGLYRKLLYASLVFFLMVGGYSLGHRHDGPLRVTPLERYLRAGQPATPISASPVAARPEVKQPAPITAEAPLALPKDGTPADANPLELGRLMNAAWFGDQHWPALQKLWSRESGWNPGARNRSSGACGIPQALPCSKINDHSMVGQISWGLDYIAGRYGNPTNAWLHSAAYGWY